MNRFSSDKPFLKWVAAIAVSALVFVGFRLAMVSVVVHGMNDINTATQQSFKNMQADIAHRAAVAEQARRDELAAQAARSNAQAAAATVAAQAAQAKAEAWSRFYTPPPDCEHPANWDAQVDCGNRYMRAKRAFEAQYSAGSSIPPHA